MGELKKALEVISDFLGDAAKELIRQGKAIEEIKLSLKALEEGLARIPDTKEVITTGSPLPLDRKE